MEQTNIPNVEVVRLRCVREGPRLRIKVITPGYSSQANCQFPRNIRVAGREYEVPASSVIFANTQGKFFYRINKNNIKIIEREQPVIIFNPGVGPNGEDEVVDVIEDFKNMKVFGEGDLSECCICMESTVTNPEIVFVIFYKCGHNVCCMDCGVHLEKCCMCREPIAQLITKDQLQ